MGMIPSFKMASVCTEIWRTGWEQTAVVLWMQRHGVMKREDATSSAVVTEGQGWRALSAWIESGAERSRVGHDATESSGVEGRGVECEIDRGGALSGSLPHLKEGRPSQSAVALGRLSLPAWLTVHHGCGLGSRDWIRGSALDAASRILD